MFKRTVPAWLLILTLVACASLAVAAIIATWHIDTTMRIKRTVSIGVYDVDGTTQLTSINLGDFTWNSGKMFPGGEYVVPTEFYFIKNIDQTDFYVSLTMSDLPDGVAVTLFIKRGDQATFTELSTGLIYEYPLISPINNPDPNVQFAYWYFRVWVNQPDFNDYAPTLTLNAHDSG